MIIVLGTQNHKTIKDIKFTCDYTNRFHVSPTLV